MRFLVLGASGLLGHDLSIAIVRAGYTYFSHSKNFTGNGYLHADLLEHGSLQRLVKVSCPDVVINLVALTSVDDCEKDPNLAYQLNTEIPKILSQVAAPNIRVIQISTDHVYDGSGILPNVESNVSLTNVYAQTKRMGEMPVLSRGGVVLRTNFFGPSSNLRRASFSDMIKNKLDSGEPFSGFSDVYFNPLSMSRLSAEILHTARLWRPGLYNLGSTTAMSKLDFARRVAKIYGHNPDMIRAISLEDAYLIAKRPRGTVMDIKAYQKVYDVPLPSLDDEIASLEF